MTIQIDVKRTGFPVKIGDLELWFDSSIENLRTFFGIDEKINKKLREIEKKAEHIHFPKDIMKHSIEEFEEKDLEKIDVAFDVEKEKIALEYDLMFGEGTFKKIYEKYPDYFALSDALEPLGKAIAKKIDEQYSERIEEVEKIKNEYMEQLKDRN